MSFVRIQYYKSPSVDKLEVEDKKHRLPVR